MFKRVKRVINWTGEYKKRLYIGFIWSFFLNMFVAMPIGGTAYFLNIVMESQRTGQALEPIWALWALLFMVGTVLGRFLFSYLRAVFQDSIAYEKTAGERMQFSDIFRKVSLGFFDRNNTGELVGAVTTDLTFFEMFSMKMVDNVVNGYIGVATMIAFLAFVSWQVALVAVVGVLVSAFFLHLLGKRSAANAVVHQKTQDDMVAATIEYLRGMPVVKAYGQDGAASSSIKKAYQDSKDINLKIEIEYVTRNCGHLLALKLASVALVVVASLLTLGSAMTLPIFFMLTIFSFMIFGNVEAINNSVHCLEVIDATFNKFEKIKKADFIDEQGKETTLNEYSIGMEHVTFGYEDSPVVKDITFTIPQNTTTAVVGPSGSGKSTLSRLIARFYDADTGKVTIGGRDVKEMTCDSLLKNISMVFQTVYLFHDTVENNIRFGKPDATREEVMEAAKKAQCHEFIMGLKNGYDTVIGEGGGSLSGGERQRISIARAMLKDAPIIILDEATASVDPENEHLIQAALSELSRGKTKLVIAHRLATIENADQILVLEDGNIVQMGVHDTLMEQEGLYRKFVNIREQAEGWSIGQVADA